MDIYISYVYILSVIRLDTIFLFIILSVNVMLGHSKSSLLYVVMLKHYKEKRRVIHFYLYMQIK